LFTALLAKNITGEGLTGKEWLKKFKNCSLINQGAILKE